MNSKLPVSQNRTSGPRSSSLVNFRLARHPPAREQENAGQFPAAIVVRRLKLHYTVAFASTLTPTFHPLAFL